MLRARLRFFTILPTKVQISPRRVAFRIVIQMDRRPRQPTTTDDAVEYFSRCFSRLPRSDRSWRAGGGGGEVEDTYDPETGSSDIAAVTRTLFHPHSGGHSRATRPTAEERLLARQFAD